jgi:hypothetical protein
MSPTGSAAPADKSAGIDTPLQLLAENAPDALFAMIFVKAATVVLNAGARPFVRPNTGYARKRWLVAT